MRMTRRSWAFRNSDMRLGSRLSASTPSRLPIPVTWAASGGEAVCLACCPTAHGDTATVSPASADLIISQERLCRVTQHQLIALARLTDHKFQVLGEEIALRHQGLSHPPHVGEILCLGGIAFFNGSPWITPCLAGFPCRGEVVLYK